MKTKGTKLEGMENWAIEMIDKYGNRNIWDFDTDIAIDLGLVEAVVYERFRDLEECNKTDIYIMNGEKYKRYYESMLKKMFSFLSYEEIIKAIKNLERNYLIDTLQNMDFIYIKTNETLDEIKSKELVKELDNN